MSVPTIVLTASCGEPASRAGSDAKVENEPVAAPRVSPMSEPLRMRTA